MYDFAFPPNCRKVRAVAYELGVSFEPVHVDLFQRAPSEAQAQIERCRRVDVALVDGLVKLRRAAPRQILDVGRELEGVTGARAAVDVEAAERQAVPHLDVRHAVERARHHALRGVLDIAAQELDRDAEPSTARSGSSRGVLIRRYAVVLVGHEAEGDAICATVARAKPFRSVKIFLPTTGD
ncbi:glutathione S-transferase N-terminal domain-containing protein [Sorangium sp. So ce295]|uniref:glutathione S-transferase N-terminal domain-containing protein n=1 Tax=Sorangium sp. So ce295 TaxID=3133295 RepID=UPI003F629CFB